MVEIEKSLAYSIRMQIQISMIMFILKYSVEIIL